MSHCPRDKELLLHMMDGPNINPVMQRGSVKSWYDAGDMSSWIEDPGTDSWNGLRLTDLSVDEAYLNVTSLSATPLWLYSLSADCVRCPFSRHSVIDAGENILKLSTKRSWRFRVLSNGSADIVSVQDVSSRLCGDLAGDLGEFGVYDLVIRQDDCELSTAKEPVNIYYPLVAIFLGIVLVSFVSTFATYGVKRLVVYYRDRRSASKAGCEMSDYGADDRTTQVSTRPARQRVRSLDTFRGLAIVIMIFVNDGAGHYWFLEHATWDGILPADFVFPWFLWIMGVCIPISIRSQLKRGTSRWAMLATIVKRAAILFGLGLMVNTAGAGSDLDTIRIPGVLQRFSLTYLVVGTLGVCFTPRTSLTENRFPDPRWSGVFQDITVLLPQWIVILSFVAAYCYFQFFAPVPGCPSGYLGPGGIQDMKEFSSCVGGMSGYVDRLVLGVKHIYQYPTIVNVYKTGPFDPEGLLGVLPSLLQVFLGVQAGSILQSHVTWRARVTRWCTWGLACSIVALVLALPDIVPINKNLWSLSFVFTTSAAAFFVLSFIYLVQDHLRVWNGVPFKGPGMNPTILYVGHSIGYNLFPFHWSYGRMNTHFVHTLEGLWGTGLWVIIGYWLYYMEFFLSI